MQSGGCASVRREGRRSAQRITNLKWELSCIKRGDTHLVLAEGREEDEVDHRRLACGREGVAATGRRADRSHVICAVHSAEVRNRWHSVAGSTMQGRNSCKRRRKEDREVLSDEDIRRERENGTIRIEPFDEDSLTPVGYDLRVGAYGFSWKSRREIEIDKDGKITIDPHDTVLIEAYESVTLCKEFSGTIHSIVTVASSRGLAHVSSTIDPGWSGKMLIQVHNYRDIPMDLAYESIFCTACFYRMGTEAKKDHGRPPNRGDIKELLAEAVRQRENEERKWLRRAYKSPRFPYFVGAFGVVLAAMGTYLINPASFFPAVAVLGLLAIFLVEVLKPR